jgi:short-subunit dehydrogenase
MDLEGRTALVTGANRGIGRAIAQELATRPLSLLLTGSRSPQDSQPPKAPTGGAREVRAVGMDLSSRESIDRSCRDLPELGAIDVLVNNAGLMTGGLLEEQDPDDVYAMFQVNLVAVTDLTARVLPGMVERGRGRIVNNASISGYAHFPAASTYAAAKSGVVAFSESLRRELRGTGVSVLHLVTPGVQTDMMDATQEVYGGHMDVSDWDVQEPEEWAAKVVSAIESGAHILGPGGRTALAKLASRGPAFLLDAISRQMFSRQPRA